MLLRKIGGTFRFLYQFRCVNNGRVEDCCEQLILVELSRSVKPSVDVGLCF